MRRRQALLGTTALLAGFAGCNGIGFGNETDLSTDRSSDSPTQAETVTPSETPQPSKTATPAETPTSPPDSINRETPPPKFRQGWSFDRDGDWTEQRRITEYPDTDDAYNWTPDYARTAEYAHVPSQEELASALGGAEVPPLGCAVMSKWALPADYSNTSVGFVHLGRKWFATQFEECPVNILNPVWHEPGQSKLESGRTIGDDDHEAEGDTGRPTSPFQATVGDDSIEVERVTYSAEGLLLGLLGPDDRVGYLAGGGWPATDTVTLHTVGHGEMDVTVKVSGESWNVEDRLVEVLNDIDQG